MNLPTFNVPPIGPKQGKLWGCTQLIFAHNSVEMHKLFAKKGEQCSVHQHHAKWNRFCVVTGRLAVDVYLSDRADTTILEPGGITDVQPGVKHQFRALEDTVALEIYWVNLDAQDIERFTEEIRG